MDLEHRYCTECMITGEAIDRRKLREEASALGSSLVIAGSQSKVRLHIRTNEPPRVFELASRFGAVAGEKADDMQRQQEMAHHATRRHVAVVTDSAADLPDSVLEALDIHVVPVRVHFGTHSYLDKVGLSSAEFFRMLAESPVHPKTSQPPPGRFPAGVRIPRLALPGGRVRRPDGARLRHLPERTDGGFPRAHAREDPHA